MYDESTILNLLVSIEGSFQLYLLMILENFIALVVGMDGFVMMSHIGCLTEKVIYLMHQRMMEKIYERIFHSRRA